jgi:hypothetical protein
VIVHMEPPFPDDGVLSLLVADAPTRSEENR